MNIEKIRAQFPILNRKVNNKNLVYLDNAATSQKPLSVINAITNCYTKYYAAIHRGIHALSEESTAAYENVRSKIQQFINAKNAEEVIFVRGTTEAINLVASSFGKLKIKAGDEIVISAMEHHSNIIPWQILCEEKAAILKVIPISDEGEIDLDAYKKLFTEKTKLIAITHVSNVLGTINPLEQMTKIAHAQNIPVLVDGAQSIPHLTVNVQKLDCDFFVFSGHKIYAPTGIGILYGKKKWLEQMPPYQTGGGMINKVTFEKTEFAELPRKFEAGTPDVADAIALGAAIDYIEEIGMPNIIEHENKLLNYATEKLQQIPSLRIIGTAKEKVSVISFVLEDIHPHDVGTILDADGIAVRAGHHCAMPLMERLKLPATTRASFGIYNTFAEIDLLVEGIAKVRKIFA